MHLPSFVRKEWFWFLSITLLLYGLSYGPIIHNFMVTPENRVYWGAEEYPLDLLGNLSLIRQGYYGHIMSFVNYSTRLPNQPTFTKMEYVLAGGVARLFHVDTTIMFFLTRLAISLLYVAVLIGIVRALFTKIYERVGAYTLILFGSYVSSRWLTKEVFADMAPFDSLVFNRLTQAMPHYLLGGLATVASLYFLARVLDRPRTYKSFIAASLLGFVASNSYAPNMVLILSSFPVYMLFVLLSRGKQKDTIAYLGSRIGILIAYAGIICIPIFYARYVQAIVWNTMRTTTHVEQLNPFRLSVVGYLFAVGLPYILSIIGLPSIIRSKKTLPLLFSSWIVVHPLGEYILSPLLQINYVRYFLTPYFVVFGILAIYGIKQLSVSLAGSRRRLSLAFFWMSLILVLVSGAMSYQANLRRSTMCFCMSPIFDYAYPRRDIMNGVTWIRNHTKEQDIVLSGLYPGTLISAFSGNHVFASWWYRLVEPPDFAQSSLLLTQFYTGQMDEQAAVDFLRQEKISYVFFDAITDNNAKSLPYTGLAPVYEKGNVHIYRVIQ
ncbi:hypothetical protein A2Z00_04015 [Candidatus Gottesmanbacteria bacterium RBG_13_45_10]|uniref:Glycosyltransferase RgtA/B/C/D-like domain-containing protein n=1 Tax=Candidatus Gottesmanbacteria bacterium RBG_13_45_10 TaxID=1798370 RepID=A0A1F5ZHF4_9BACT|nr:MAG: hypothetical protein A2Z00_04015 [Candidatus Gottesmanbacteria bacterium RBG_13_45_10]